MRRTKARGQALCEYILLVGLIAIGATAAIVRFRAAIAAGFERIANPAQKASASDLIGRIGDTGGSGTIAHDVEGGPDDDEAAIDLRGKKDGSKSDPNDGF